MTGMKTIGQEFRLHDFPGYTPKGPEPPAYFAGMVVGTHSRALTKAIADIGTALDVWGYEKFFEEYDKGQSAFMEGLLSYFGVAPHYGALTHSTTFGLAQVFAGIRLRPGQEILTTVNEHAATIDTLRLRRDRDGTPVRQCRLFADSRDATRQDILESVERNLLPETRVLALTWVYSSDGVKLPIADIAAVVRKENAKRKVPDRIILVVDGVHGFGVDYATFDDLGCDFFVAGLHKNFMGPRGTAILCGTEAGWDAIDPIAAPLSGANAGPADRHFPGGVRAYDHWFAVGTAFQLHLTLGPAAIATHIRSLVELFREGIDGVSHLNIVTPRTAELSAGIICLDVEGTRKGEEIVLSTADALSVLKDRNVLATSSSMDHTARRSHVRFSLTLLNTTHDVARAVAALKEPFTIA